MTKPKIVVAVGEKFVTWGGTYKTVWQISASGLRARMLMTRSGEAYPGAWEKTPARWYPEESHQVSENVPADILREYIVDDCRIRRTAAKPELVIEPGDKVYGWYGYGDTRVRVLSAKTNEHRPLLYSHMRDSMESLEASGLYMPDKPGYVTTKALQPGWKLLEPAVYAPLLKRFYSLRFSEAPPQATDANPVLDLEFGDVFFESRTTKAVWQKRSNNYRAVVNAIGGPSVWDDKWDERTWLNRPLSEKDRWRRTYAVPSSVSALYRVESVVKPAVVAVVQTEKYSNDLESRRAKAAEPAKPELDVAVGDEFFCHQKLKTVWQKRDGKCRWLMNSDGRLPESIGAWSTTFGPIPGLRDWAHGSDIPERITQAYRVTSDFRSVEKRVVASAVGPVYPVISMPTHAVRNGKLGTLAAWGTPEQCQAWIAGVPARMQQKYSFEIVRVTQ